MPTGIYDKSGKLIGVDDGKQSRLPTAQEKLINKPIDNKILTGGSSKRNNRRNRSKEGVTTPSGYQLPEGETIPVTEENRQAIINNNPKLQRNTESALNNGFTSTTIAPTYKEGVIVKDAYTKENIGGRDYLVSDTTYTLIPTPKAPSGNYITTVPKDNNFINTGGWGSRIRNLFINQLDKFNIDFAGYKEDRVPEFTGVVGRTGRGGTMEFIPTPLEDMPPLQRYERELQAKQNDLFVKSYVQGKLLQSEVGAGNITPFGAYTRGKSYGESLNLEFEKFALEKEKPLQISMAKYNAPKSFVTGVGFGALGVVASPVVLTYGALTLGRAGLDYKNTASSILSNPKASLINFGSGFAGGLVGGGLASYGKFKYENFMIQREINRNPFTFKGTIEDVNGVNVMKISGGGKLRGDYIYIQSEQALLNKNDLTGALGKTYTMTRANGGGYNLQSFEQGAVIKNFESGVIIKEFNKQSNVAMNLDNSFVGLGASRQTLNVNLYSNPYNKYGGSLQVLNVDKNLKYSQFGGASRNIGDNIFVQGGNLFKENGRLFSYGNIEITLSNVGNKLDKGFTSFQGGGLGLARTSTFKVTSSLTDIGRTMSRQTFTSSLKQTPAVSGLGLTRQSLYYGTGQYERTESVQFGASGLLSGQQSKLELKPSPALINTGTLDTITRSRNAVMPAFSFGVNQNLGINFRQTQPQLTQQRQTFRTPGFNFNTSFTSVPFVPFIKPGFNAGGFGLGNFKASRRFKYTPSFNALVFNIRGKAPKGIETGARLRPITKGFRFSYNKIKMPRFNI